MSADYGHNVYFDVDPHVLFKFALVSLMLPPSITAADVPPITMYDMDFRKEVAVMYNAVMKHQVADALSSSAEDMIFMWSNPDWMSKISNDPEVLACGHSGATEAMCFRYVRAILQGKLDLLLKDNKVVANKDKAKTE